MNRMTKAEKEQLVAGFMRAFDMRTKYADKRRTKLEEIEEKSSLSKHGMWDLGYWTGYQSGIDAMYDRMMLIIDKIETEEEK